jgi:hypothetical protein
VSKDAEQSAAEIAGHIFVVRGMRVMMDSELAKLYGTETRVLNQAVRRNRERFPGDFIIELTDQEVMRSRSQSVILNTGRGSNVKHPPLAFTEHGAIMAATVLNSPRADDGLRCARIREDARGVVGKRRVGTRDRNAENENGFSRHEHAQTI